MKTITFTEEELSQIEGWYNSAAGESATVSDTLEGAVALRALLQKLDFEVHCGDANRFQRLGLV